MSSHPQASAPSWSRQSLRILIWEIPERLVHRCLLRSRCRRLAWLVAIGQRSKPPIVSFS